jgi:DNA-directed RNA polymerase subunit beta'
MTRERTGARGAGMRFFSPDEVRIAYDAGELDLHAAIKVRMDGEMVETTAGRVILNEIVPEEIPFEIINQVMDKKALGELIDQAYRRLGNKATVILADRLRTLGYESATRAGVSIAINDMEIPKDKQKFIGAANVQVAQIEEQYQEGLITDGERYNKVIDIWADATERVAEQMLERLGTDVVRDEQGKERQVSSFNPIYMMADSGARGSTQQMRQLAGMRGLMAKPSGEIIENPITSNFREGLSVLQYFISTHGARKGLADTALKTANSGYLTRRLVDVSQDMIIREVDCGTTDGIAVGPLVEGGEIIEPIGERILGRVALEDVRDPLTDARGDRRGEGAPGRGCRYRERPDPLCAHLRDAVRRVQQVLRTRSLAGRAGQPGRGRGRDRGPVHRRTRHPAHDADLPHRWHGHASCRAVACGSVERRRGALHESARRRGSRRPPDCDEPERRTRAVRRQRAGT